MSEGSLNDLFEKDTEYVFDRHFYQRIFKRTERLLSGVTYINSRIKDSSESSFKEAIGRSILDTLDASVAFLMADRLHARTETLCFTKSLMRLSTLLSLAISEGGIHESHGMVLKHEIDTLLEDTSVLAPKREAAPVSRMSRTAARQTPAPVSGTEPHNSPTTVQATEEPNRQERIKEILKQKGQIGIKDISDIIKNVSEKSIQRDLNDLIMRGEVVRKGERRWSQYSIAQGGVQ